MTVSLRPLGGVGGHVEKDASLPATSTMAVLGRLRARWLPWNGGHNGVITHVTFTGGHASDDPQILDVTMHRIRYLFPGAVDGACRHEKTRAGMSLNPSAFPA